MDPTAFTRPCIILVLTASAFIPYEYKKWFLRDTRKKTIELIYKVRCLDQNVRDQGL